MELDYETWMYVKFGAIVALAFIAGLLGKLPKDRSGSRALED